MIGLSWNNCVGYVSVISTPRRCCSGQKRPYPDDSSSSNGTDLVASEDSSHRLIQLASILQLRKQIAKNEHTALRELVSTFIASLSWKIRLALLMCLFRCLHDKTDPCYKILPPFVVDFLHQECAWEFLEHSLKTFLTEIFLRPKHLNKCLYLF